MAAPPLTVGVPTEVKDDERRVAVTPDGIRELQAHDVPVLVQAGAGLGASITDDAYRAAGATIVDDPAEVWERAGLIVKVKEPQPEELALLRSGPDPVHLPPPGCLPEGGRCPLPRRHDRHRLRDGDARGRLTAACSRR